jgi:hypothetical protein
MEKRMVTREELKSQYPPAAYEDMASDERLSRVQFARFLAADKFVEQKRKDNQRYLLACAFLFGAVCGAVGILTAAYFFYGGN